MGQEFSQNVGRLLGSVEKFQEIDDMDQVKIIVDAFVEKIEAGEVKFEYPGVEDM